jgi:hypothetical protein
MECSPTPDRHKNLYYTVTRVTITKHYFKIIYNTSNSSHLTDRQRRYNVNIRCVRAITVGMEKPYVLDIINVCL